MLRFQFVMPCYNEERNIESVVRRSVLAAKENGFKPNEVQLLLVENGSNDQSYQLMSSLKKTDLGEWFEIVKVNQNQGYGYGIASGLRASSAPIVGWTHADQQCDPHDVFRAFKIVTESKKVIVKGRRKGRSKKEVFVSRTFEFIANIILNLGAIEINAQPKVFRRELIEGDFEPPNGFEFDLYILYRARKLGYSIEEIEVQFPARIHGISNWANSLKNRYKTIMRMIGYIWRLKVLQGRL